jgi:hypothetical protein
MKKIRFILIILIAVLAFAFAACNRNNSGNSGAEPTEAELQAALEAIQQMVGGSDTTAPASTPATTTAPASTPGSGGPTNWTRVADTTFGTSDDINAIAYGGGRWVAGGEGGKMAYSTDNGVTWTAVADSTIWNVGTSSTGVILTASIQDIAYVNNRFVAVGGGGRMAYSSDGVSWTAGAENVLGTSIYGTGNSITAIAYGNNRFVAVGSQGKMAYSDDNGVTWTAVADSTFGDSTIYAIAYGNNRFVAASHDDIAYSADGANWTAVADRPLRMDSIVDWIEAIGFGGNRFVAGARTGIAYSDNGASWTSADGPSTDGFSWGNNRFVCLRDGRRIAYSADGISWTRVEDRLFTTGSLSKVAYGNGRFIVATTEGQMAYCDW